MRSHLLGVVVHIFAVGGALLGALGAVTRLGRDKGILVTVVSEAGVHQDEEREDELQGEGREAGKSHPANSKSSPQRKKVATTTSLKNKG